MTNVQLWTVISAQFAGQAILIGILIAYINAKFETAKAELLRVEGVLDARLKHLEDA